MGLKEAQSYFKKFGIEDKIIVLDESSATVPLAAQALGTEEARIAKSLTFDVKSEPIMIIVAGDGKIDNRKFKDFFHTKAKMLSGEQVIAATGHGIGGVCPFGDFNETMKIYLDESLKRFKTVFPATGGPNTAIELTIPELEKYSNYNTWIDVCKGWNE